MEELRCLHCNERFDREQGHRCSNSPWVLGNQILQDIQDELNFDDNEIITSKNLEPSNKQIVSDVHAVPGPSRLALNESEGSLCQREFQPNHTILCLLM
ncbi:hypothetical protein HNY73_009642 [Argiope bruennichi]|uniref:Uncharacterized protein n=1 Tax=Argiope bruennichi TaxID=94029 RepID=A0A8T0FA36_ARGBR|nr:hypothetical protein HNY73_009642 [Argiope bruennichi]